MSTVDKQNGERDKDKKDTKKKDKSQKKKVNGWRCPVSTDPTRLLLLNIYT